MVMPGMIHIYVIKLASIFIMKCAFKGYCDFWWDRTQGLPLIFYITDAHLDLHLYLYVHVEGFVMNYW